MDGPPSYDHLRALTDHHGVFEHALLDRPRREHGYCVDDVARALIVAVREPDQTTQLRALAETCLRFLDGAVAHDGLAHNRMSADGVWTDEPAMGDWWGRLIWGAGTAAARGTDALSRDHALRVFERAVQRAPADLRTHAFAALGAAEVLSAAAEWGDAGAVTHRQAVDAAHGLLVTLLDGVAHTPDTAWTWPERRLEYANAAIPDAVIAAGAALGDHAATRRGVAMLTFLVECETDSGRLSVAGSRGRDPGQCSPLFDQQPIEVGALADACARAFAETGDAAWLRTVGAAWRWFLGDNDSGTVMFDAAVGAGFDGLQRDGRNENRGAESTLAALSTYQQARRLGQELRG